MLDSEEKTSSKLFSISMWWRIVYGVMRIFFGLALLKVIGAPLIEIITSIMEHELMSKSPDIIYTFISSLLTEHNFSVTYFLSFYFIFWGSVDIFLSYHLLKDNLWAFPISMVLICLFIIYSLFRFTFTHSLILLGVVVLDIIILFLINQEYKKVKCAELNQDCPDGEIAE